MTKSEYHILCSASFWHFFYLLLNVKSHINNTDHKQLKVNSNYTQIRHKMTHKIHEPSHINDQT